MPGIERQEDINKIANDLVEALTITATTVAPKERTEVNKLSEETRKKIEERRTLYREGKYDTDNYREVRKEARRMIRTDVAKHYEEMAINIIKENGNTK